MYLNCYSKATVKYAVTVFHETITKIPNIFDKTETSEAAKYCQILDQFLTATM